MKQSKTIQRTINKIWEMFDKIDSIHSFIKHEKKDGQFCVTFYHDAERNLIATRWSDRYYGADEGSRKGIYVYCYSINSRGIHFESYVEMSFKDSVWGSYVKHWSVASDDNNIPLLAVPNNAPPNNGNSMYIFHQEKIRETLAVLPAWAIAVMG